MKLQLSLSVLLFINFFSAIFSCSIEQVFKETVENEMKNLVLLKRQLSDSVDSSEEDSSEVFGGINDRDFVYMSKTEAALKPSDSASSESQSHALNKTAVTHAKNCSCRQTKQSTTRNSSKNEQQPTFTNQGNNKNVYNEENQYDKEKRDKENNQHNEKINHYNGHNQNDENIKFETSTVNKRPVKTTLRSKPTPTPTAIYNESQDVQYDIKDIDDQIDSAIRELCPNYKDVPELDVQRMADVWQLAYYKGNEALSCFKIFLKRTTLQSRRRYEEKYSSFNDSINWHECLLELASTGKHRDDRKHFLQATQSDKGILDNIIISVFDENDKNIITLQEQTPDQWLVTHNLLLMRDCGSGDVIIFTRIPSKPSWAEVEKAMNMFGENGVNGTVPCDVRKDDRNIEDVFRDKKYYILS